MEAFPAVDPIPLPAPVWLFKVLHLLTLALHFCSVHLLVGGLFISLAWILLGRAQSHSRMIQGAGMIANRLPVVMAYVINLGVPPLLFAQVLYGRAIYTSSILIGAYWISVIALLIISYWFLYASAKRAESGRPWWWSALASLLCVLFIADIYVNNMTLMARPQVWQAMYAKHPTGIQLNAGDPTVLPRWVYMVVTSLTMSGFAVALLGLKTDITEDHAGFLRSWGARLATAFALAQAGAGGWVLAAQPGTVAEALAADKYFPTLKMAWLATIALALVLGAIGTMTAARRQVLVPALAALGGFLNVAAFVLMRDRLRDVTLLQHGYDVTARAVESNWSVVGAFLVLFVLGLAGVGWMIMVLCQAKGVKERYA